MDHSSSFCHAGKGVGSAWGGGERKGGAKEFWEGVGCADGAGREEPGIVGWGKGGVSIRDGGQDFGDGEALADYTGGHYEGAASVGRGRGELGVHGAGHAVGIFDTTLARDCIGAAGVDDDGADTFAGAGLEDFLADGDGGGAKGVLGEDGCGGARVRGGDEGEVWEMGVARFDADVDAGGEEAFGIGAGCWDIFLFGGGDGAVDWGRVAADLTDMT